MAIVEFLATRPTETFSASELARRVGVNKSTAYTLIRTLHRAGWVFRSPADLRYGIGPVLAILGEAATQAVPEVSFARPVMDKLASEFRRECVFSTLIGDEIVILHTTGPAELGLPWSRPGTRASCAPPFGTVFVAWQSTAAQKEWYERGSVVNPERFQELAADLAAIRKRGFVATMRTTVETQLAQIMKDLAQPLTSADIQAIREQRLAQIPPVEYLVGTDDTVGALVIDQLQAPIFDGKAPRYALTVRGIDQQVNLRTLTKLGKRVRAACDEVTAAIAELRSTRRKSGL